MYINDTKRALATIEINWKLNKTYKNSKIKLLKYLKFNLKNNPKNDSLNLQKKDERLQSYYFSYI